MVQEHTLCQGDWWIKCMLRNAAFLSSFLCLVGLRTRLPLNLSAASNNNQIISFIMNVKIHLAVLKGCYWTDITAGAPKVYVRIYNLGCCQIDTPGMPGSSLAHYTPSWLLPAPAYLEWDIEELHRPSGDRSIKNASNKKGNIHRWMLKKGWCVNRGLHIWQKAQM